MHKPIYYPVESKTNGFIDYNEVISILTIDDLYKQVKKQKEVIDKLNDLLSDEFLEVIDRDILLQILEDKEV